MYRIMQVSRYFLIFFKGTLPFTFIFLVKQQKPMVRGPCFHFFFSKRIVVAKASASIMEHFFRFSFLPCFPLGPFFLCWALIHNFPLPQCSFWPNGFVHANLSLVSTRTEKPSENENKNNYNHISHEKGSGESGRRQHHLYYPSPVIQTIGGPWMRNSEVRVQWGRVHVKSWLSHRLDRG